MKGEIDRALEALGRGAIVAAPTESFFGLLTDAGRIDSVDALVRLKTRADKGAPVLLPSRDAWKKVVLEIPPVASHLADRFWPGPFSIALEATGAIDPRLILDATVAVRLPGACLAAAIVERYDRPVTATSANPTGEPPATRATEVKTSFAAAIAAGELVVVGETAPGGLPSTIVIVRNGLVEIVREGAVPAEKILATLD